MTPLSQLAAATLAAKSELFDIRPAVIFNPYSHKGSTGHKFFVGPNAPRGALISYYVKEDGKEEAKIVIAGPDGEAIRELKGAKKAGIHRLAWDLRYAPVGAEDGAAGRRFSAPAPYVLPGEYRVTLQAGGLKTAKTVMVEGDPRIDVTAEARKAQHDALMGLYRLAPLLNETEKTLNSLRNQLEDAEGMIKKVAEAPAALKEAVQEVKNKVQAARKELLGDPQAGFRGMRASVRGRLLMLARSVGGYTGAPSERQLRDIAANTEKLNTLVGTVNAIIVEDIPRLNTLMDESNIPYIGPVQKIKTS